MDARAPSATPLPPVRITRLHRLHRHLFTTHPFRRATRRFWPRVVAWVRGARFALTPQGNHSEEVAWQTGDLKEPRSLALLLDLIRDRPAFVVDVGANCGFFAVYLACAATPESRVLAFEPNPEMAARLRRNLALNRPRAAVEVHETALSDGRAPEATLHLARFNLGSSTLEPAPQAAATLKVPARSLAAVLAEAPQDARIVVKMDIEGHEPAVLAPLLADPAARLPHAILIETSHAKDWPTDIRRPLRKRGFRRQFKGEGNTLFIRPEGSP